MAKPRVSAMYIVKDEREYFPFSVRSIFNVVDEIVVVDGYSTDGTAQIARGFPKVKLLFSAERDFSHNRNLALSAAAGDWLMPMDADMVFYNDINEAVPRLTQNPHVDVYTCWFYHLMRDYFHMQNSSDRDPFYLRPFFLVRRTPHLRWVNPVHEHLTGTGPNVMDSGLHFVHYGYVKSPREVFARWVKYADLEGKAGIYNGLDPDHILDDRPLYPFTREHPEVIRDYIARKLRGEVG